MISRQGTTGNYFYFLESGQCDVIKDGNRISYVFPGKSFGELALLNSATRQVIQIHTPSLAS